MDKQVVNRFSGINLSTVLFSHINDMSYDPTTQRSNFIKTLIMVYGDEPIDKVYVTRQYLDDVWEKVSKRQIVTKEGA